MLWNGPIFELYYNCVDINDIELSRLTVPSYYHSIDVNNIVDASELLN